MGDSGGSPSPPPPEKVIRFLLVFKYFISLEKNAHLLVFQNHQRKRNFKQFKKKSREGQLSPPLVGTHDSSLTY